MALKHAVLAEVANQPDIAHKIYQRLDERVGEFWDLNAGGVRLHLQQAAERGLVCTEDDDGRKRYVITPEGTAELERWVHETDADARPHRDDLYLKVLFYGSNPNEELVHAVGRQLQKTSRQAQALHADLEALQALGETTPEREVHIHILRGALEHANADVRWLKETRDLLAGLLPEQEQANS